VVLAELISLTKSENKTQLQDLLKLHVLPGNVDLSTVKSGSSLKTLAGNTLPVEFVDGKYNVAGVTGIDSGLDATSGNIRVYAIGDVLNVNQNPEVLTASSLSSSSVQSSLSLSSLSSSSSNVVAEVTNRPEVPQNLNAAFITALEQQGNFTLFVNALRAADLKNSLESTSPITVFAPNDTALKAVQSTYDNLLKPENKAQLQNFVRMHIVNGTNSFEDFKIYKKLVAQNGRSIVIKTNDKGVGQVIGEKNTAQSPSSEIQVGNAIIHTLSDTALLLQ
jgi:uncharacterized surface protein with fasciclin (FAS1) repeats